MLVAQLSEYTETTVGLDVYDNDRACVYMCNTLGSIPSTKNHLIKGWILWHVNYISVVLIQKKKKSMPLHITPASMSSHHHEANSTRPNKFTWCGLLLHRPELLFFSSSFQSSSTASQLYLPVFNWLFPLPKTQHLQSFSQKSPSEWGVSSLSSLKF